MYTSNVTCVDASIKPYSFPILVNEKSVQNQKYEVIDCVQKKLEFLYVHIYLYGNKDIGIISIGKLLLTSVIL